MAAWYRLAKSPGVQGFDAVGDEFGNYRDVADMFEHQIEKVLLRDLVCLSD